MNENFSFLKGYHQLKVQDTEIVRNKIMKDLDIKSRQAFWRKLHGFAEPRMTEIQAIERIFGEYGITEIWGK